MTKKKKENGIRGQTDLCRLNVIDSVFNIRLYKPKIVLSYNHLVIKSFVQILSPTPTHLFPKTKVSYLLLRKR